MYHFVKRFSIVTQRVEKAISKFSNEMALASDEIMIFPYLSYASEHRLFLKGRVLTKKNIMMTPQCSKLRNIINSYRRFESDEIPNVEVGIRCYNHVFKCITDKEGYFTLDTKWKGPKRTMSNNFIASKIKLLTGKKDKLPKVKSYGEVLLPSANSDFGIITDIDDTVLKSYVTSFLRIKMLYTTFSRNAYQRLPIEGMVDLFNALVRGGNGQRRNPVFYVSNSPWNIYDLLEEFLDLQGFPKGALMLRDYSIKPAPEFYENKKNIICNILETYPDMSFVLLGDTADDDADFYIDIARRFPNRIKAIYIRQTKENKNAKRVKKLIEKETDINAKIIHASSDIYKHALKHKMIYKGTNNIKVRELL